MQQQENNNIKISLAPLQGLTDYTYRNTYASFFDGIDVSYSPFLRIEKGEIRKSKLKDILPENNKGLKLIPQILTKSSDEFLYLANIICEMEYDEINWNLGCPYPMVAKQGMGAGMLRTPDSIKNVLDDVMDKINCRLSVKMRTGYENHDDILKILPILNEYDISDITVHPRTGKQIYKGDVDLEAFRNCLGISNHEICYNGDIKDIEAYKHFNSEFPEIKSIMIGRGIISNPFLATDIKGLPVQGDRKEIIAKFHDTLFDQYCNLLSGDSHILNKMIPFWEYIAESFSNSRKVFKAVKKSYKLSKYETTVRNVFKSEDWVK